MKTNAKKKIKSTTDKISPYSVVFIHLVILTLYTFY